MIIKSRKTLILYIQRFNYRMVESNTKINIKNIRLLGPYLYYKYNNIKSLRLHT